MASLYGFEIDADRELRRLSVTQGPLGTVRVRATSERILDESCELLHLIAGPDGAPTHVVGRCDDRLLSWHSDGGSFLIDGSKGRIDYRPDDASAEAGSTRWEDRLGSTALPLLAGERGGLPLHASAVGIDGRAVVICGVTGRGKSTLAAALVARGHEAIAEDGVVVRFHGDQPVVWPGLGGALITTDAATAIGIGGFGSRPTDPRGRVFIEPADPITGPMPVAAVSILMEREGDRVEVIRSDPAKAHRELLAHVLGGRRSPPSFTSAARLVERVPITLLVAPDSLSKLGAAAEALESLPRLGFLARGAIG